MERSFGADFSGIRVHADERAATSARSVDAAAYTVGRDLVFGDGQLSPGTAAGRELIAHELAHAVQQRLAAPAGPVIVAPPGGGHEHEAEAAAHRVTEQARPDSGERAGARRPRLAPAPRPAAGRLLQRRMVVADARIPAAGGAPATSFRAAVQGLIDDTCPSGGFRVDTTTGVVSSKGTFCQWHAPFLPDALEADVSPTPTGCRCLCDVVNSGQTANIAFGAGGPSTSPGSVPGTGAAPGQAGTPTDPTVSADPRFHGQYFIAGRWVDIPFHLIFSHELCGHALPKMRGTHAARGPTPPGGTPPQERTAVDVERAVAAEHAPPLPRRPEDYSGAARQRP